MRVCGLELSPDDLAKIPKLQPNTNARVLDYQLKPIIAITAHIVRNNDGTGGITEQEVIDELAIVNDFYANAGMEFYIREWNYIDNSSFLNFQSSEEGALASSNDVPNTINVYFVDQVSFGLFLGNACGYAYMPGTGPDRIFLDNDCAVNGSTFAHEIGHIFNLFHTHGPTNRTDELVNGSNCETAGDLLCDTPADPTLSTANVNVNCNYTGSSRDANNQFFNPLTDNVMSYSRVTCRDAFTNDQYQRMYDAYVQLKSYYITKPVNAEFEADKTLVCEGESVSFIDHSLGATSYSWTFEGGTPATSTIANPTVVYNNAGVFDVSLTINAGNGEDTEVFEGLIRVKDVPDNPTSAYNIDFDEALSAIGEVVNPNNDITFTSGSPGFDDNTSLQIRLFNSNTNNRQDFFKIHPLEIDNVDQYLLQFSYAYATNGTRADRLSIALADYCNETEVELWSKSGEDLATTQAQDNFVPTTDDWKIEGLIVDVTNQAQLSQLIFKSLSKSGNNIFIDNIRFRPTKASDQDSLILLDLYQNVTDLPWDLSQSMDQWAGVSFDENDMVSGLDFSAFELSGAIPSSIANLNHLEIIKISGNEGLVWQNIGTVVQLDTLIADQVGNQNLITDWSSLTNLKYVSLQENALDNIPTSLLELNSLKHLDLSTNSIQWEGTERITINGDLNFVDLRYNGIEVLPELNFQNVAQLVNFSHNRLTFEELEKVNISNIQNQILSPQEMYGHVNLIELGVDQTIELTCPIDGTTPNTTIDWYKDGVVLNEQGSTLQVSGQTGDVGNYTCEASNTLFADLKLRSRPTMVNTTTSLCDFMLAGTYDATSSGTNQNQSTFSFQSTVTLTASGQNIYTISDISGGFNDQSLQNGAFPLELKFDCGSFYTPDGQAENYSLTSSGFDYENNEITLKWIHNNGASGTVVLTRTSPGLSNKSAFESFSLISELGPATIDHFNKTIDIAVGCKEGSNKPDFVLSGGATAYVNGVEQVSGITTVDFSSPVNYTVVAEDGFNETEWVVTLTESPSTVSMTTVKNDQSLCNTPNGSIAVNSITVNGQSRVVDTDDFDIVWSDDQNFNNILSQATSIENLTAGEYWVRVTEIISGCVAPIQKITIEDITPVANINLQVLNPDRSCGGVNTGEIEATITGLLNPYTLQWSQNNSGIWDMLSETDELLTDLEAGQYKLLVTDDVTGCTFESSIAINAAPSIIQSAHTIVNQTDCANPNGSIAITNLTQDGQTIGLPASGYTVEWANTPNFSTVLSTGYDFTGLASGTYYYRVTDEQLQCVSNTRSVFVNAQTLGSNLQVDQANNNTICVGGFDGSISVSVEGNTTDYNFDWYNGTTDGGSIIATGSTLANISSGVYTVKATSNSGSESGCYSLLTTSIANSQPRIDFTIAGTSNTSCTGGNGTAKIENFRINGQTAFLSSAYEIEWSTSPVFSTVLGDDDELTNLTSDRYYARITDPATGCVSSLESVVIDNNLITISPQVTVQHNTHCETPYTGSLAVSGLTGNLSDYTISWKKDDVPISGGASLSGLSAGVYGLNIIHNASGCTFSNSYTLVDNLISPSFSAVSDSDRSCIEDTGWAKIESINEGGTNGESADYNIEWSTSESFASIYSTEDSIGGLSEGRYYVRIKNKTTGCEAGISHIDISEQLVYPEVEIQEVVTAVPAKNIVGSISIDIAFDEHYFIYWFNEAGQFVGDDPVITSQSGGVFALEVEAIDAAGGCFVRDTIDIPADNRALQEITFSLPQYRYFDELPLPLEGSSDRGLDIQYRIIGGSGVIEDNALIEAQPGIVTIEASNPGSDDFFEAADTAAIEILPLATLDAAVKIDNDLPLSKGTVFLLNPETKEVEFEELVLNGGFEISGLKEDTFLVRIIPRGPQKERYFSYYFPGSIFKEEAEQLIIRRDTAITFEMLSKPSREESEGAIYGYLGLGPESMIVLTDESQPVENPLEGLSIRLQYQTGEIIDEVFSEENGQFTFIDLSPSTYSLSIDQFGLDLNLESVELEMQEEGDELNLHIIINNADNMISVDDQREVINNITELQRKIKVYPVPSSSYITIEKPADVMIESYTIFDASGKTVAVEQIDPLGWSNQIDISRLSDGIYILQLASEKSILQYRIIKR